MVMAEEYSGPLPHPDLMNRYGDEAQKTVLALALDEPKRLMRVQLLGFIFAMTCLLSGVFLILNDKDIAGSVAGGAVLLVVLMRFSAQMGAFLGNGSQKKRGRDDG